MTVLYYTFFTECLPGVVFDDKLRHLPVSETARIKKFRRWQDAHASLFGKLLLQRGLRELGVSTELVHLKIGQYGKPYLEDCPVSFNISHSGSCVVCIVSSDAKEIGIDIEQIKLIDLSDFRSIWSEADWDIISTENITVFYEFWTRKEAFVKAEGKGFNLPMNEIQIESDSGKFRNLTYFFKGVSIDPEYVMIVASENNLPSLKVIDVPALEL